MYRGMRKKIECIIEEKKKSDKEKWKGNEMTMKIELKRNELIGVYKKKW